MRNPTLVAVAHGSRDARFAQNARRVVRQVRSLRPDLDVRLAFLELSEPNLLDVLGDLSGDAVVVPLLLSDAYHARIDLPTVLSAAPARLRVMQACVLGADNRLLALARRRVTELGIAHPGVILSAVGSSDSTANTRTRALAAQWPISTTVFATGDPTSLAEAAESLRTAAPRTSWWRRGSSPRSAVGPGARQAAQLDMPVAAPLGADRLVADVVVQRYASAIAAPVPTPH